MDDEDVILPNSPLFEYFQEEFPNETEHSQKEVSSQKKFKWQNLFQNFNFCNSYRIKQIAGNFASRFLFRPYINTWKKKFKLYHELLQKNNLLVSEDCCFLKSTFLDMGDVIVTDNRPSILQFFALLFSFTAFFIAAIVQLMTLTKVYDTSCMVVISFVILVCSIIIVIISWKYYKFLMFDSKVVETCTNIKNILDILKKHYRIIRETEVIAQGFTLAASNVAAERLELSNLLNINARKRQLPELRRSLFTWLHKLHFHYRDATCYLIKTLPLPSEISVQCFATMSLEEFGVLLKLDPSNDSDYKKLLEVSDNLSLSSLKSLHELLLVQISEFYKCFCICFIHYGFSCSKNNLVCPNLEQSLKVIDVIKEHDVKLFPSIKESYILVYNMKNVSTEKAVSALNSTHSPTKDLIILLHNFNLHVRSLLTRVIHMEEHLVQQDIDIQRTYTKDEKEYFADYLKCLEEVKSTLSLTQYCYEECYKFTENQLHIKPVVTADATVILPVNTPAKPSLKIIENCEPIIDDEVFEAIIEHCETEESKQSACYDDDSGLSKCVSVPLMQELKKVLVFKAEEHRCREEKAIRAKAAKESSHLKVKNSYNTSSVKNDTVPVTDKPEIVDESSKDCHTDPVEIAEIDDNSTDFLKQKFDVPVSGSFASLIAAMALQRQKQLILGGSDDTFEFGSDNEEEDFN